MFAYLILPFRMEGRTLTTYGFIILGAFIACFCAGALLASRPMAAAPRSKDVRLNFALADNILRVAVMITIVAFGYDLISQGGFDLASSYQDRSDRAGALLAGAASDSSIGFQIGFLFYPAAYVYILREIGFSERPSIRNVVMFGLFPVLIATLAMGGRAPLFYAILLVPFGFSIRTKLFGPGNLKLPSLPSGRTGAGMKLLLIVSVVLAARYFVSVFFVRADASGGAAGMFGVARDQWGVSFNGFGSGFLFTVLGEEYTYLLFIFTWYLVQGLVMSNVLFSEYAGPANLGIYGVDLAAALMRRINGDFVADRFGALLQLNTYGFLPSAFGSLYVDLFFFGLIVCVLWGWLAGFVYMRVQQGQDPRYLLIAPFITLGVFFSLINTPIGFSNGLLTHFWMLVVFFTVIRMVRVAPETGGHSGALAQA